MRGWTVVIVFQKAAKYDFKLRGQQFVVKTSLGLVMLAFVYVLSHTWLKPESLLPKKEDIFTFLGSDVIDESECNGQSLPCRGPSNPYGTGILIVNDESDASFYMGREAIELFMQKVYQRNREIENIVQTSQVTLIRSLGVLRRTIGSRTHEDQPILDALTDAIDSGRALD